MGTLYEIVSQAQIIEQQIAEAGGELSPELEQALANVDLSLTEKVEGYAQVIDRLESVSEYWSKKAKELSAISDGVDTAVKRIEERLKSAMIELRKDEVFGESIRFKLSTTKGSLVIEDSSKIPSQFLMTVTTTIPDKEKIREALERADEVPGAKLLGGYRLNKYANRKA